MREINVKYTNVYKRNLEATAQVVANQGGAGSSKSYSLSQLFIFERLLKRKNYNLLILRKTRHANKLSNYMLFIGLLQQYGIYNDRWSNKSDLIYRFFDRNNIIRWDGLEEKEKIKSTDWHDIWCEEMTEFEPEDLTFLKTRLYRGEMSDEFKPRIWLTYNPVDCWLKDVENRDNVQVIKSTYKDNPFCNEEYRKTLEGLKDEDYTYYQIYTLNQWGIAKNLIFRPFTILQKFPERFDVTYYGLDFGYNHKTALEEINEKDAEIYVNEKIWESGLTNQDLIDKMKDLEIDRSADIYADNEAPDKIKEICEAGFTCKPCPKGPGSVKAGIDHCKSKKIYSSDGNVGLNTERKGYKWRVDKNGNILDEPVKFKDDAMSSLRYGLFGHAKDVGYDMKNIKQILDAQKDMPDRDTENMDWD